MARIRSIDPLLLSMMDGTVSEEEQRRFVEMTKRGLEQFVAVRRDTLYADLKAEEHGLAVLLDSSQDKVLEIVLGLKQMLDGFDEQDDVPDATVKNVMIKYKLAKTYYSFITDDNWITKQLNFHFERYLNAIEVCDIVKDTVYAKEVKARLQACIEYRLGIAPNVEAKGLPNNQLLLIGKHVNTLRNPKKSEQKIMTRGGVLSIDCGYPQIQVALTVPEETQISIQDLVVLNAVYSIYEWNDGLPYIPLTMVCKVLKNNEKARISEKELQEVAASIKKLRKIDFEYTKRYDDQNFEALDGPLINALLYTQRVNNVLTKTAFLYGPQLAYLFSTKVLNHVIRYDKSKVKDIPGLKNTEMVRNLIECLLYDVTVARRNRKSGGKLEIKYDTLFDKSEIIQHVETKDAQTRKKKQAKKCIHEILTHWVESKFIASFTMEADRLKISTKHKKEENQEIDQG